MAWLGLDKLLLGYSLDDLQNQSNTLDTQINAANQAEVDQGYQPQSYADTAAADIQSADLASGASDVVGSVDSEFVAGAQQGLNNVLAAPGKAVGLLGSGASSILGGILKNIPWWAYLQPVHVPIIN